jgi:ribonuclease VapC
VIVLDASALLALINNEPGADVVARAAAANDATISSVNYAEVLQKTARLGELL